MDATLPKGDRFFVSSKNLSKKPVLFVSGAIVLSLLASVYVMFFTGPNKVQPLSDLLKKEPKVELKKESKNPFSKETQFVNPFSAYKNQLYALKQFEEETQ